MPIGVVLPVTPTARLHRAPHEETTVFNPQSFTFRPDSIDTGRRGTTARIIRCQVSANSAAYRDRARRAFAIAPGYRTAEIITPYAIDGIHAAPTTQRMFGPAEARERLALARDCSARALHFDIARDRILARALSALSPVVEQHERDASRSYIFQQRRAAEHRATAQLIAMHEQIERATAHAAAR